MSRNSKRTRVQHHSTSPQQGPVSPPIPNTTKENPFGVSFVVPTEIVHLPSGGDFYEEGNPIKGLKHLEIKAMTAKEEDIIMNESFISQGIVFDKLIDSLMLTEGVKAADLLDCDKMAILMSAAKTGYGDKLEMDFQCDSCGHQERVTLKLSSILEDMKDKTFKIEDTEEVKYDKTSKTLIFELPITKIKVRIKTMTPSDYKYLDESRKQKEKHKLQFSETVEFLRKIIIEANGVTSPADISQLLEVLPSADGRKIIQIHNSAIPTIDKTQVITCSECSAEQKEDVPFNLGTFWS